MVKLAICVLSYFTAAVYGVGFTGKFVGIPEDAVATQNSHFDSPIINGVNYQSRIEVTLTPIVASDTSDPKSLAVKRSFDFEVPDLHNGEYQLTLNSYDFQLQYSRYKVVVDEENISVYEDSLGSKALNQSSLQKVGPKRPLLVDVVGYKEYYESPQGKITEMVMNSPLGFIFKNSLYTALFVASMVIMVAPYVLTLISPELAEQVNEMQNVAPVEKQQIVQPPAQEVPKASSGRAKGGRQRKI